MPTQHSNFAVSPTQPNLVDDARLQSTASPHLFPHAAIGKLRQFLGCTFGGFLLLAVLLKLQATVPDAYYFGIWGPVPLVFVAICAQAFVAAAMLRHSDQRLSWALAAVLFLCLFAVALEKSVTGLSDCGCFGVVRSNARTTAIMDGVVLAFCASFWWIGFRRPAEDSSFANSINQMKNALAGAAAFLLVGLATVAALTIAGLGEANGTRTLQVPISPLTVQSIDDASRMFVVQLPFHNRGRASVRIIGFSSGCSGKCSTALPIEIEPGETATLEIHSKFATGTRNGLVSVPVFTSDAGTLMNRVRFVAQR